MLKPIGKLARNSGQHTIEYATIVILIMAGIIIGGPNLIRSWNANMKGWEDSVIDSYEDPLLQGDVIPLPGCSCAFEPGIPPNDCGIGNCDAERVWSQCVCDPVGCGIGNPGGSACQEGSGRCDCDLGCCTAPQETGACGAPDCPDGEMRHTVNCGCASTQNVCIPHTDCQFNCTEPLVQPFGSSPCPGYGTGLAADTPNVLVNACTLTTGHCHFFCDPPNWPQAGNTICAQCAPGEVLAGGNCGPNECETPIACSPGQCAVF